jgi:hypothetical protein
VSPNEDFRRELNNVFDEVSGSPSPALRDRVRSAIAEAPAERSTYWIAAVAACLITALIVGILYVNNPFRRPVTVGPGPTPSPIVSPSPEPTPTPTPPSTLPAFQCTADTMAATQRAGQPLAYVSGVRTGANAGYDRLVIDFANGIPAGGVELRPQAGTTFTGSPSGQPITLKGTNGILIVMRGADLHTSYSGSTDIVTGYAALAEVRVIEDFEGVVQLGLGIKGPACYRAFYLDGPIRLVVDVQAQS